jgi:hypothetical protein
MDIVEFFKLSAGKWSSIRSSHDLNSGQQVASKATLQFEWLEPTAPEIAQLVAQHQFDASLVWGGWRLNWEDVTDLGKKKLGQGMLVAIANADDANQGTFFQVNGSASLQGRYAFSQEKLCLMADAGEFQTEEQLWFESDNVRLRSSVAKNAQGLGVASFYSEVRLLSAPKT